MFHDLGSTGRSMFDSRVLLFACFAFVIKIPEITTTTARPLYAKDGFLAGEKTPVWFAELDDQQQVKYTRIANDRPPIVLNSVNYWKWLKQNHGFPVRVIRSVNDSLNFTRPEEFDAPRDDTVDNFSSPSPIEKRSIAENEVLYPSILVVMDYNAVYPPADRSPSWSVEDLVIYALAFWGTVDSSLRNIKNPRVSLRIAGIIITKERNASPYLKSSEGDQLFVKALSPMMDHWRSVATKNPDFPIGSYDIVAHMADSYPWSGNNSAGSAQNNPIPAAALKGPPCDLPDEIAGLIFYDDFAFDGLHRAIAQMSKVLGGSDQSPKVPGWPRRKWTKEILDPISNALQNASCMSAPKEYHPPGAPVAPILAGEIMPNEKQCAVGKFSSAAWTCWDSPIPEKRSNCNFLYCANCRYPYCLEQRIAIACTGVGLTLDGSFCNAEETKICLDGECVDKPRAT